MAAAICRQSFCNMATRRREITIVLGTRQLTAPSPPSWLSTQERKCYNTQYLETKSITRSHHHSMQKKTWIQTLLPWSETISDAKHLASVKTHLEKGLKKYGYTDIDTITASKTRTTLEITAEPRRETRRPIRRKLPKM